MQLRDVWDYFDPSVKRAIRSACRDHERISTSSVLGALAELAPEDAAAREIAAIETDAGVELTHPYDLAEDPEPCPEEPQMSPCLRETLNFFRMHQLHPITPADLALRLLQIGSGSTVRALEATDRLEEFYERLRSHATLL